MWPVTKIATLLGHGSRRKTFQETDTEICFTLFKNQKKKKEKGEKTKERKLYYCSVSLVIL